MRAWICLAATAACFVWTGCTATPSGPTRVASPTDLSQVGMEYRWNLKLPLLGSEKVIDAYVLDENLYLRTDTNRVLAIRAIDGVFLWSVDFGASYLPVFRPWHVDNMDLPPKRVTLQQSYETGVPSKTFNAVLLHSPTRLLVLDRAQGTEYRDITFSRINIDLAANAGGASDGRTFLFGAMNGKVQAIRLREAVRDWKQGTDDLIFAPIVHQGGYFYVGDLEGKFYAINPRRQKDRIIWSNNLEGPIREAFAVDERGICFVPCRSSRLYAFNGTTGDWLPGYPVVFNGDLTKPVQLGDATAFQYVDGEGLWAVDIVKAAKRWSLPAGRLVLGVHRGTVYVLDADKNLRLVDEITGSIRATISLGGFATFAPTARHDRIWAVTAEGHAYCLQETGLPRIQPD